MTCPGNSTENIDTPCGHVPDWSDTDVTNPPPPRGDQVILSHLGRKFHLHCPREAFKAIYIYIYQFV